MSDGFTRLYPSHEAARQAATALGRAGIAHDAISVLDQVAPPGQAGRGGTVLTVRPEAGRAAEIERLLSGDGSGLDTGAPPAGLAGMDATAPAYVAGATANLGVPGEAG